MPTLLTEFARDHSSWLERQIQRQANAMNRALTPKPDAQCQCPELFVPQVVAEPLSPGSPVHILPQESRVATLEKSAAKLIAALEEVIAFAADREDVIDGDYGTPAPNDWMQLARIARRALGMEP